MPAAASYLCEITPLSSRARLILLAYLIEHDNIYGDFYENSKCAFRVIAFLCTLGISGGIFAGACAIVLIPLSGQQIVTENRQHFSAWHRYLLLVSIIPIISTILLTWLPESPRYLLANGSEVEALATYQVRFPKKNSSTQILILFFVSFVSWDQKTGSIYRCSQFSFKSVSSNKQSSCLSI